MVSSIPHTPAGGARRAARASCRAAPPAGGCSSRTCWRAPGSRLRSCLRSGGRRAAALPPLVDYPTRSGCAIANAAAAVIAPGAAWARGSASSGTTPTTRFETPSAASAPALTRASVWSTGTGYRLGFGLKVVRPERVAAQALAGAVHRLPEFHRDVQRRVIEGRCAATATPRGCGAPDDAWRARRPLATALGSRGQPRARRHRDRPRRAPPPQ